MWKMSVETHRVSQSTHPTVQLCGAFKQFYHIVLILQIINAFKSKSNMNIIQSSSRHKHHSK